MRGGFGNNKPEYAQKPQRPNTGNARYPEPPAKPSYAPAKPLPSKPVEHTPSPNFKASDPGELAVGQRVEHQKFGFGKVIKMEGATHNPIATIQFELNGEKKIMLNYAKISIVD
jgi:DNA helicase-2/ATP-dependent DNA helicase PcrA